MEGLLFGAVALLLFVVIPFSDEIFILNLDVGIFFVLALSSVSVIGVLMAGWASANKFSLIGALRAAAQLIAYELPLVLGAAAIVMQAETLSMVGIVEAQEKGWVSAHTLGFGSLAVALLAIFVVVERQSSEPLVRLSIFRVPTVRAANVVMFVVAAGLFAMFFFNTLYVQRVLGYSKECGDAAGWRYDDPAKPTRILLCQNACDSAKQATEGKVSIAFGCKTKISVK